MKYYEVLYENCFNKRYIALKCGKDKQTILDMPTNCFNGTKVIDVKETSFENFRKNEIKHFLDYGFSVS